MHKANGQQQLKRKEQLRQQWTTLTETEQAAILTAVAKSASVFVRSRIEQRCFDDPLVELACLDELEERLC